MIPRFAVPGIGSTVLVLLFFPYMLSAADRGHYLVERNGTEFRLLEHSNKRLTPPVGSLLKPFAAWYLLENGVEDSKQVFCPPERKRTASLRCWTPGGHGALTMQEALAQSCNYYFLMRFQGLRLSDYQSWLKTRFDWPDDLPMTKPENVYGFDLPGGLEPEKMVSMYSKLLRASETRSKKAELVVKALEGVCNGTLKDFCRLVAKSSQYRLILGKTGTVREGKRNYGIAMVYIEDLLRNKKVLLLCYEKNKMGSEVALNALAIIDAYNRKTNRR